MGKLTIALPICVLCSMYTIEDHVTSSHRWNRFLSELTMIDKDYISDDLIGKKILELDDYVANTKITEKILFNEVSFPIVSLSFTKSARKQARGYFMNSLFFIKKYPH